MTLRRDFIKFPLAATLGDQAFGGWEKAASEHFADGGSFDRTYSRK